MTASIKNLTPNESYLRKDNTPGIFVFLGVEDTEFVNELEATLKKVSFRNVDTGEVNEVLNVTDTLSAYTPLTSAHRESNPILASDLSALTDSALGHPLSEVFDLVALSGQEQAFWSNDSGKWVLTGLGKFFDPETGKENYTYEITNRFVSLELRVPKADLGDTTITPYRVSIHHYVPWEGIGSQRKPDFA
jgi:hypothetical protein